MLRDVLDALKAQLEANLTPPEGVDLHIEGRAFAIAETPAIDIYMPPATGYEEGLTGFAGHIRYGAFPVLIRARVGTADIYAGEDLLLDMMDEEGDMSILAALDADRTLGGAVDSLTWGTGYPWSGYEDFPMSDGNGILLGSTMPIVIVVKQS